MVQVRYLVIDEADTLYASAAGFDEDMQALLTPLKGRMQKVPLYSPAPRRTNPPFLLDHSH